MSRENAANRKFHSQILNFQHMAHEYINRRVIAQTMDFLKDYKRRHPESVTPMRDAAEQFAKSERGRFKRAAQQLHWNVCTSRGKVYENGVLCW